MAVNWKSYDFHPQKHRQALTLLFETGIAQRIPVDRICDLANMLINASGHDNDFALHLSERLVEYAPEADLTWLIRGMILRKGDQIQAAVEATRKALELKPNQIDGLILMAGLQTSLGDFAEAERLYRTAFDTKPNYVVIPFCEFLVRVGKTDEALEALQRRTRVSGQSTASRALESAIHQLQDNQEKLDALLQRDLLMSWNVSGGSQHSEVGAVCDQIVQELASNDALIFEPGSTATAHGHQAALNDLLPPELCKTVIEMIQRQAERYVALHGQHPCLAPQTSSILKVVAP